jgi:hypothetical protein
VVAFDEAARFAPQFLGRPLLHRRIELAGHVVRSRGAGFGGLRGVRLLALRKQRAGVAGGLGVVRWTAPGVTRAARVRVALPPRLFGIALAVRGFPWLWRVSGHNPHWTMRSPREHVTNGACRDKYEGGAIRSRAGACHHYAKEP